MHESFVEADGYGVVAGDARRKREWEKEDKEGVRDDAETVVLSEHRMLNDMSSNKNAALSGFAAENGVEYLRTYPRAVLEDEPSELFAPAPLFFVIGRRR